MANTALDMNVVTNIREVMGDSFITALQYYMEDTIEYIKRIEKGLREGSAQIVVAPAHTIKSSSHLYGAEKVSHIARQIEEIARLIQMGESNENINTIAPLFEQLCAEFDQAQRSMRQLIQQ